MKKIFVLFFIIFESINLFSQTPEFQFTLYAEDYFGNIDSVVLGYDSTATEFDGWDTQFGEIDITNTPFDSIFELRASVSNFPSGQYPHKFYQTKKEIVRWQCFNKHPFLDGVLHLSVRSVNLPVRFSWDKDLFQDTCNNWIAMSEINNWEIGGYNGNETHAILKNNGFYIAFNNGTTLEDQVINYVAAIEGGGTDTIYGLTMYFWPQNRLFSSTTRVKENLSAKVYPNPARNAIQIEIPEAFKHAQKLYILNAAGQIVKNELITNYQITEDLVSLSNGLYFYVIENRIGEIIRGRFVKSD